MQTNSKKSPHLTATAGLLAGVIVTTLAFSVTALNFNTVSESSEMAFVTQQFVNPNLNNANPNGNPNANPNAANPNLNPNLLWLWTLRFNFVMRNAPLNNIVNPSCNTVANVGNPGIVPGSIDFVTTTNPNPVPTICGLMNAANQIVAIGNQNQLAGTF